MGSAESGTQPVFDQDGLEINNNDKNQEEQDKKNRSLMQKIHEKILHSTLQNKQQKSTRPSINSLNLNQFQVMFAQSGQNIQKFFELVEGRISDLYLNLGKQTLQLMCEKKLRATESKIFISQEVLFTSINILKLLGIKTGFKYDPEIVTKLNNLQMFMLGYMKVKYPRQNQNFVPGQLMQEFKNFDYVERPQNDILKQLDICFWEIDQNKISYNIKKLINLLIDQLDEKFPIFEQLLSQKVFVVTKQGRQYTVQNKIGRKIPESVEKFNQNENSIDLKSPEILRVIIKWVNDMQSYLLQPQQQVKQKDHFKTAAALDDKFEFDYIAVDQIQQFLPNIEQLLEQQKVLYQNELKQLKNQIQLFNHNLLKILSKAQRNQKYVPKRQAEIIKYSMFNKKLLSWMILAKLKIVLQKLIKVSQKMQQVIGYRIDFVKFNVTDLMRAMMVGNKFEIMKVFNNLKSLQSAKVIEILKIKNRLETPLNDVMVIFKMSGSFIICQLQLIMSGGHQSTNQKLKNVQILNHFFYELQRSPYGVMTQLAALLSFKDSKTSFEDKITFQKISQLSMKICLQKHPQSIIQQNYQKNPFICSYCTEFYGQYQNQYIYKYCKQCNQYSCTKCIFQNDKQLQAKYRQQAIKKKIQDLANAIAIKQHKKLRQLTDKLTFDEKSIITSKDNMEALQKCLARKTKPLRQISKKKGIVTYKQIEKYLDELKDQKKKTVFFAICNFVGKELQFFGMKRKKSAPIRQCFRFGKAYDKQFQYKYFDFIVVFESAIPVSYSPSKEQPQNFSLFQNFARPTSTSRKYNLIMTQVTQIDKPINFLSVIVIFDILYTASKEEQDYNSDQQAKQFQYQSIQQMRKNLPNLLQVNEVTTLTNEGIADRHLVYFSNTKWKTRIKYVNLHKNNIRDISIVLNELPSLQKLIISRNYVQKISFTKSLPHFNKLIAFSNQISSFEGIQNIPNVAILNLQSNNLAQFQISQVKLPHLRVLNLYQNCISKFSNYSDQFTPHLAILCLEGDDLEMNEGVLNLSSLTHLTMRYFNLKSLTINHSKYLEYFSFKQCWAQSIKISDVKRIKKLQMADFYEHQGDQYCGYDSDQEQYIEDQAQNQQNQQQPENQMQNSKLQKQAIQINILGEQFSELVELKLENSYPINILPVLKMPKLKNFYIFNTLITNYSNLSLSNLSSLQILNIDGVRQIQQLPILRCPFLKELTINSSKINKAQNVLQWELPILQKLTLGNFNEETQIPGISKFPLKELSIVNGKFKPNQILQLKSLIKVELSQINLENLTVFILPNLAHMTIMQCLNLNMKIFQNSQLDSIKFLEIFNSQLIETNKILPILNIKNLQVLKVGGCQLADISNLKLANLPALKQLNFNVNNISKVPTLKFLKLQSLQFSSCQIKSLAQFSLSELPSLKKINFDYNKIQELPVLKIPQLSQAFFEGNQLRMIQNLSLSNLKNLTKLYLFGQKQNIKSLPVLNLPLLKKLDLNVKQLKSIQNLSISKLDSLQKLHLQFTILDNTIFPKVNFPNMHTISLQNTNITDISNLAQSSLPALQQLGIGQCNIKVFPILRLNALKRITCICQKNNRSGLQSIQNLKFCKLPNLQSISIENTKIQELPQMSFPKLKNMYIKNNNIKNLRQFQKSTLPELDIINIYDNPIKQVPIGKYAQASTIYMNNAQVQSIDQIAQYAPTIQIFYYNNGKIPETKWQLLHFRSVKILQLSCCSLINVDNIFKNSFQSLTQLSLNNNQIVKPPKIIAPKLKSLFLSSNCIKDVTQLIKSDFPQIHTITMDTNEIEHLPDFPFVNTTDIFLSHNFYTDISFISKRIYTGLVRLVMYDVKISKLGKLNAPILQQIYFNQNCITSLEDMKGSNLPLCNLLQLSNNKIVDISPLNYMQLKQIQTIYLTSNNISKLPSLNLPSLTLLNANDNPINHVSDFVKKKLELLSSFSYSIRGDPKTLQNIKGQINKVYQYTYCSQYVEKD